MVARMNVRSLIGAGRKAAAGRQGTKKKLKEWERLLDPDRQLAEIKKRAEGDMIAGMGAVKEELRLREHMRQQELGKLYTPEGYRKPTQKEKRILEERRAAQQQAQNTPDSLKGIAPPTREPFRGMAPPMQMTKPEPPKAKPKPKVKPKPKAKPAPKKKTKPKRKPKTPTPTKPPQYGIAPFYKKR